MRAARPCPPDADCLWHDLLHGLLHFEGKIWRTLPLLAWWPGELTRRYIEGARARFVSPMALFLFFGLPDVRHVQPDRRPGEFLDGQTRANFQQGMSQGIQEADKTRMRIEAERARVVAAGGNTAAIDAKLKEVRDELSMLRLMRERGIAEAGRRA